MYSKKCPKCNNNMSYKNKSSLVRSINKNAICKKCTNDIKSDKMKGGKLSDEHKKNIGISVKGLKRTDESKKRYSESKKGDKNPSKRPEVKEKIRNSILKKYLLNPENKDKISKSLIKFYKNNKSFISHDELNGFSKFKNEVKRKTNKNKKELLEKWDGKDYYDNEYIKNNYKLHYNNKKYPTIDHKISLLYGFKHNYSVELISSTENLCITKRSHNSSKGALNDKEFKKILKQ